MLDPGIEIPVSTSLFAAVALPPEAGGAFVDEDLGGAVPRVGAGWARGEVVVSVEVEPERDGVVPKAEARRGVDHGVLSVTGAQRDGGFHGALPEGVFHSGRNQVKGMSKRRTQHQGRCRTTALAAW